GQGNLGGRQIPGEGDRFPYPAWTSTTETLPPNLASTTASTVWSAVNCAVSSGPGIRLPCQLAALLQLRSPPPAMPVQTRTANKHRSSNVSNHGLTESALRRTGWCRCGGLGKRNFLTRLR